MTLANGQRKDRVVPLVHKWAADCAGRTIEAFIAIPAFESD
jgi:hypothetical protein